jgi:hypothetical protein
VAAVLAVALRASSGLAADSPLLEDPSPYVQERARDLVEWRAWGQGALEEARRRDQPVFLFIGDPACAPCRSDERAAFGDPDAARLVNAAFVSAVVDRFERPDLASLFAVLDVQGPAHGRPLAVFLLPDGRPFAAQAGLAREDQTGSPGLKTLALRRLSDFQSDRGGIEAEAAANAAWLLRGQSSEPPRGPLARAAVDAALKGLREAFDEQSGGFGPAGEVPPGAPRLLLEEYARRADPALLRMASASVDALAARQREAAPHTLALDAILLRTLAQAYGASGSLGHRAAAEALATRVLLEMREAGGAFVAMGPGLSRDERVIAGGNGLMIGALATSGSLLQRASDLDAAARAAARVKDQLGAAGSLRHSARGAAMGVSAFLDDYAYLADGILDLHDATGDPRWLPEAVALVDTAIGRFADPSGGFFAADAAHEPLPVRPKEAFDVALPSGNGVMARVLLRLARATGEARYRDLARATIEAFRGNLQRAPRGMETLVAAVAELLAGGAGQAGGPAVRPSRQVVGPVSLEADLSTTHPKPGVAFEARIRLAIADGWRVVARNPGVKDLFGLTVSLVGEGLVTEGPVYPEARQQPGPWSTGAVAVYAGEATVKVPLRVKPGTPPGAATVGLRVVFQPCDAGGCKPPLSGRVELPMTVEPAH